MTEAINFKGYNGQVIKPGKVTYPDGPLMLGSGKLDKTGTEIHEDDIVEYCGWVGLVQYEDTEWFVILEDGQHGGLNFFDSTLVEIVGNIHLEDVEH